MIECCSKKRMLTGIICLGLLSFIVLIFESHWAFESSSYNHFGNFSNLNKNVTANVCSASEDVTVVKPCHPCSDFEVTSKINKACVQTHFKETIHCTKSGRQFDQSCDKVEWLEEKNFWQFELVSLALTLISTPCVVLRQRFLDQKHLRNLQRRLARSV